jgi:hypothetical protein
MTQCKLLSENGAIAIVTPYDQQFLYELKRRIPANERRYVPDKKYWLVSPQHGKKLQDICLDIFNEIVPLPVVANSKPVVKQQIIDCRYIGATKDRGNGEYSAYGYVNNSWSVLFPETVLRTWFDAPAQPDEQPTLYAVLGIRQSATEDELKSGYRRMARQWHPDACREPNAHEQFLAIQHAYEVLTKSRDRYDAGLALEATLRNTPKSSNQYSVANGYRSPLRCGLIMCEGVETIGVLQVQKIFAWEDIKDSFGRVLVVSWKAGEDKFTEVWC